MSAVLREAVDVISDINSLEQRAYESEAEPSDIRWEQARLVAEALDGGMTTRQLAAQWLNPESGEPYGKSHVAYVARCWQEFGHLSGQQRPRWNTAYNSPEVRGHNHRAQGTGENEWYTPEEYIKAARKVMGGIDLDPASTAQANEVIKARQFYTIEDDGLEKPWHGRVWLNPPYAQPYIAQFVEKLAEEFGSGNVQQAILLTHNYTDTGWFHTANDGAALICFTRGRIPFVSPEGEQCSPTQGQAFFYYGDNDDRFREVFTEFGFIR